MNSTNITNVINLLNKSHSVYHVVKNIEDVLKEKGFIKLDEKDSQEIVSGNSYYVKRNNTSIIAFRTPNDFDIKNAGFKITATHNDSPTFKLKPNPVIRYENLILLNTEPYGGGIYNTWLDKPLSIAGRILYEQDGKIHSKLLDIDEDLLVIPNLCIHMNRTINTGYNYNPAIDLRPVLGTGDSSFDFVSYLKEKTEIDAEASILSHDLFLYNREEAKEVGMNKEFIASGRLDDLASTFSTLLGFVDSKENDSDIQVYASFDNEEVGSLTRQGANSTLLKDILYRILMSLGGNEIDYRRIIAASTLLSIDNAHANHPNHPEISDSTTKVLLNKGIVIKYNANQSYTSDGFSSAIVKGLCLKNNIPYQEYTNRSDLRGGSTLGNISNSEVSLVSVDIGLPQLSMHSSYEFMGKEDIDHMVNLVKSYFNSTFVLKDEYIEL